MRDLKSSDLKQIMDIGYSVVECTDHNVLRTEALCKVQDTLAADSSVYMRINKNHKGQLFLGSAAHGHPESEMTKWCRRYQPHDPFVGRFLRQHQNRSGRVIASDRVVREKEYLASKFYQEFLKPMSIYHVLLIGLTSGVKPLGVLGFHRPRNAPAFSEREIAIAEMIAPHFSAASLRTGSFEKIDERERIINYLAEYTLNQNLLVLDQNLKLVFASDSSYKLLGSTNNEQSPYFGNELPLPKELLQQCSQLRRMNNAGKLRDEPVKFKFQLPNNGALMNVVLRVVNWSENNLRFMICLRSDAPAEMLYEQLEKHGLTPRQIDIAQLVGVGLTNSGIAEKLCISTRTVENHLRAIYEKAGVNNRTSLVYRLALKVQ